MASNSCRLDCAQGYDPAQFDLETRRLLRTVIAWFEARGKTRLLADDLDAVWVSDFLEFIKDKKVFATFLTPSEFGDADPAKRWDTARNAASGLQQRSHDVTVVERRTVGGGAALGAA